MAANVGNQLYIPHKIKVGYQKRDDTYTKRLAYVIYFDNKGKLRKETSWNSWRDHKIEPEEFDNTPHSGFVLNKDVKRSSEWFCSGRNMIRVYDDRGIEFEITTGNLLFILMTTDCMKRGLTGEFVYAWQGTELVLLPVGCDEYQNSAKFTQLQHTKVSVKALVPGCAYKTRKGEDFIYLGKFEWLDRATVRDRSAGGHSTVWSAKKKHVFISDKGNKGEMRPIDPSSLAEQNSDVPVSNYAELVEKFTSSARATKAVELIAKKAKQPNDKFYTLIDGVYREWHKSEWYPDYYYRSSNPGAEKQYYLSGSNEVSMGDDGSVRIKYDYNHYYGYMRDGYMRGDARRGSTKPSDPPGDRVDLFVKLESGAVISLDKYTKQLGGYYGY
jgi:hypothetical protein